MADINDSVVRYDNAPGVAWVAVNTSADVDFLDESGITGGKIPRNVYVEVGGTLKFDGMMTEVNGVTVAPADPLLPDNFYLNSFVTKIYSSGTTAQGVWAIL